MKSWSSLEKRGGVHPLLIAIKRGGVVMRPKKRHNLITLAFLVEMLCNHDSMKLGLYVSIGMKRLELWLKWKYCGFSSHLNLD